jgi:predicted PolB exonuclease-like 3'-5' exonuclease
MNRPTDTAYIVFDTESVVDGALLARVLYPGSDLAAEEAIARYEEEQEGNESPRGVFIPVSFHVPVAIGVARVGADFRLLDIAALDTPRFDPRAMVTLFWKGVQVYSGVTLVDFNGRGFDIPLLSLAAFRFGIPCPRYFADPDRFGFRYRFTPKHMDLLEWLTEYGAFGLRGGLNLLAKLLGKPGKMTTQGNQVGEMYREGRIQEINDYCLHDVLDTYFVFLRTRVLAGAITLEAEQGIVAETREWLAGRVSIQPALGKYLEEFGSWNPEPFR